MATVRAKAADPPVPGVKLRTTALSLYRGPWMSAHDHPPTASGVSVAGSDCQTEAGGGGGSVTARVDHPLPPTQSYGGRTCGTMTKVRADELNSASAGGNATDPDPAPVGALVMSREGE
jgi:hypothetical protein